MLKFLENLSEKEILNVNIPTGIPLVYELDTKFNIIMKNYLIDSNTLKEKQALVENQGKMNIINEKKLMRKISKLKVLVIGDLMLDFIKKGNQQDYLQKLLFLL